MQEAKRRGARGGGADTMEFIIGYPEPVVPDVSSPAARRQHRRRHLHLDNPSFLAASTGRSAGAGHVPKGQRGTMKTSEVTATHERRPDGQGCRRHEGHRRVGSLHALHGLCPSERIGLHQGLGVAASASAYNVRGAGGRICVWWRRDGRLPVSIFTLFHKYYNARTRNDYTRRRDRRDCTCGRSRRDWPNTNSHIRSPRFQQCSHRIVERVERIHAAEAERSVEAVARQRLEHRIQLRQRVGERRPRGGIRVP